MHQRLSLQFRRGPRPTGREQLSPARSRNGATIRRCGRFSRSCGICSVHLRCSSQNPTRRGNPTGSTSRSDGRRSISNQYELRSASSVQVLPELRNKNGEDGNVLSELWCCSRLGSCLKETHTIPTLTVCDLALPQDPPKANSGNQG